MVCAAHKCLCFLCGGGAEGCFGVARASRAWTLRVLRLAVVLPGTARRPENTVESDCPEKQVLSLQSGALFLFPSDVIHVGFPSATTSLETFVELSGLWAYAFRTLRTRIRNRWLRFGAYGVTE